MPIHPNRVVLIVDDTRRFAEKLASLLSTHGYSVEVAFNLISALEFLAKHDPFTFVLVDRQMEGRFIEDHGLELLTRAAERSHIVVYTRLDELNPEEIRRIYGKGAKRVLDRKDTPNFVHDVGRLIKDLDELLELSNELNLLTRERDKLVTALVGADIGVAVVDTQFHCWFGNCAQERLVGGRCSGGLCWERFHGHPTEAGPCWGCTVERVIKTGEQVDRLFLSRFRNGSVSWVSVQSVPIPGAIRAGGATEGSALGKVIAVREGVMSPSRATINNMNHQKRLECIAQGLVHVGFGRSRIWAMRADGKAVVRAAASVSDDPWAQSSDYQDSMKELAVNPDECMYNRRARESALGCLVRDWSAGPCPWNDELTLELPYFIMPVRRDEKEKPLWGFVAVDFVGLREGPREEMVKRYAKEETLVWLNEGYVSEVKKAFESFQPATAGVRLNEAVERAQLAIGAARTVDEGLEAVQKALKDALPQGCTGVQPAARFRKSL